MALSLSVISSAPRDNDSTAQNRTEQKQMLQNRDQVSCYAAKLISDLDKDSDPMHCAADMQRTDLPVDLWNIGCFSNRKPTGPRFLGRLRKIAYHTVN